MGTLAGMVDVAQQLLDRAVPSLDVALADELGNAYGAQLDAQVISGSGAAGQLLGLLSVTGITSVTYTSATPTASENLAQIGRLVAATATAFGGLVDTILLHPRRAAFIRSKIGGAVEWPVANVVEVGSLPVNLGAGTNEDTVVALQASESPLFVQPSSFRVFEDVLSANLSERAQVFGYASLLVNRQPASIGKLTGAGLATPTW